VTKTLADRRDLLSFWGTIGLIVLVEFGVRFVVPFKLERVLLVETIVFVASAAVLNSLARRSGVSTRFSRAMSFAALALILGAIRSALWLVGIEVQIANLTILLIGFLLFGIWRYMKKRKSATTK